MMLYPHRGLYRFAPLSISAALISKEAMLKLLLLQGSCRAALDELLYHSCSSSDE
jgi:hypothetical protein